MRKGLKLIQQEVKATAPVESGETRRNVKVRSVKAKKRGTISLEVRIKATDKLKKQSKAGKTTFYPAVVEYKFKQFMKRVFQRKGNAARSLTMSEIHLGIDREVRAKG